MDEDNLLYSLSYVRTSDANKTMIFKTFLNGLTIITLLEYEMSKFRKLLKFLGRTASSLHRRRRLDISNSNAN